MEYKGSLGYRGNIFEAVILDVLDGDSVEVDIDLGFDIWHRNQLVRLNGLDTPETRTRDLEEKKYGLLAEARLKQLLPIGSKNVLHSYGRDKFGRILGDLEVAGDKTVLEVMIDEYHGLPYSGGNRSELKVQHIANRSRVLQLAVEAEGDGNAR